MPTNGLRKRIVNFSNPVEEAGSIPSTIQPPVQVPDIVRSLRSDTTSGAADEPRLKTKSPKSVGSRKQIRSAESSEETDEEGDDGETVEVHSILDSSNIANSAQFTEGTTSATEWIGITTNESEEENSYTSELDASDSQNECSDYANDCDFAPTVILNPCCGTNDRSEFLFYTYVVGHIKLYCTYVSFVIAVSCTIWEHSQTKKAEMSVLDISSAIIERVDAIPDTCEYVYIGLVLSIMLSLVPVFCRLCEAAATMSNSSELHVLDIPAILMENTSASCVEIVKLAFGNTTWEQSVLVVGFLLRICLTFLFFFVLAVAERTFKQRFLYAKLFSHLTSSRRACKSKVPHFRLNKVRNIKIWLSVRSYLKRRGPQRSVDVIVSAAFILTLLFLSFLSVEWLKV